MKENLLISKSKDFALKIIALCKDIFYFSQKLKNLKMYLESL